ncbi:enoyl-CoA hydratase/isomerase family protein [Mycobacterium sp. 852002-10029_SCH5224772]|uniref:enoyl-CoA hydratase/isomerase family protein n=1 Tax=Mycobacterium sp. 852002-10029_SCH5224772 TaxID=1834083 RepID=UPI0007FF42ED|nr:enoyl-CoA hydratase/isomerase family protein [Mycobacterium sp. 852002-10029_SCH5224772]OBF05295.1 enoyl-CoA hydratase [Mycobacterium sp. 852002-10029_SCH5224772]
MTVSDTLRVHVANDRVVVELHRPEQRNAINAAMVTELHRVCADLERDPRLLIITGAGSDFAAGADIAELRARRRDDALAGINRAVFDRIAALAMPTIAAVEGNALGGGAELAYACDLRIAGAGARFGNPEPGLGILAAAGASYRIADLVGRSIAKQVILGGRLLDAEAAVRHGLVCEVVEAGSALSAAHALADRIGRCSTLALRLSKAVLDAAAPHPLLDDLAQAVLFESPDKADRMTRFLEKSGT